jgi:RES domain-containing protein
MDLWRISKFPSLNGEGGRLADARWHTAGSPIVYLAASPAGALLEILVHLELGESETPPSYTLLRVSAPASVRIIPLRVPAGEAWKTDPKLTRTIGNTWLKNRRSALARVPSVLLPATFNYLLNPLHTDAAKIRIAATTTGLLDARLAR